MRLGKFLAGLRAAYGPTSDDGKPVIAGEVVLGLHARVPFRRTGFEPNRTSPDHLRWMLEQIHAGKVGGTKAHRWLGFVQGVLAARGQLDVDAERDRTRPFFTEVPDGR